MRTGSDAEVICIARTEKDDEEEFEGEGTVEGETANETAVETDTPQSE
jgi:hypothetical protein